ncbi:MAG: 3-hydroxyacyl-CoA dehydrogenase family protein [Desulfarculaceae bacterium]|nr:3-hydroxyacyl-CoA dehydrogenase family protein [Desulfarculaceae bacterium]MCF8049075.1 3-hydroxyacyl-CoA dehydrogenase family protein [Desulfarculaceae bacterium]MCF8065224.1 3-hydroxyacyl-CoA dehydrogenase family protein [Desulfarculaceae bacterium]MCF8099485.1 3-hydroxyacyl-CoA dehydrogenase family protein [Desulfarculaceae bacterium]
MQPQDIKKIAVVGLGLMGPGIAQVMAQAGYQVSGYDLNKESYPLAKQIIANNMELLVEAGQAKPGDQETTMANISLVETLEEAVAGAQIVIEVVSEKKPIKQAVYEQIDKAADPDAIIWSNTSTLNIFELMPASRLPRTLIVHWFAPPQILPLIEVVQGPETLAEVVGLTMPFLEALNKRPVLIKDYVPGFIINRLLRILGRETYFLLDNGYVTPEDLDMAVKASIAPRMMVLGLTQRYDFTGLDLTYANLHNEEFKDAPEDAEPEFIVSRVKKNHLGIKTGIGVYDYRGRDKAEVIKDRDRYLLKVVNSLQFCLEKKRLL